MINKLLSTAVKIYLRSQITQAEELEIKILGKNRQILQGYIPQILLTCNRAVYQGLALQQVEVKGTNVGFNLSEVLQTKSWQLLEPIVVDIKLSLDALDLQASLASPLLQSGLNDLWQLILSAQAASGLSTQLIDSEIEWQQIAIADNGLNLTGICHYKRQTSQKIDLFIAVSQNTPHILSLFPKITIITNDFFSLPELQQPIAINLGNELKIEQLIIASQKILCRGKITVKPS